MSKPGAGVIAVMLVTLAGCFGGHPMAAGSSGPSSQIASITLAPAALTVQNPATRGGASAHARIRVSLTLTNQAGARITSGTLAQPVRISVYGPSPAVLTAETPVIKSATSAVYFDYNGRFLANPVIATAVSGHAFAQMSLQPRHRGFAGSSSVTFPMTSRNNIAQGWGFQASVGGGPQHFVEMDTGSRGLVVPASILGRGAIGPGAAGKITYTSDGKEFLGHYYLAPLTLSAGGSMARTVPIRVLAVDKSACVSGYPKCRPGKIGGLGVMGVGFDRGQASSMPPELTNAFLAITGVSAGAMHPGYIIRRRSVTLGITVRDQAGFNELPLIGGGTGPGDWNTAPGCFSFPRLSTYPRQCGTVLVDTGIASAILGLPKPKRPASMRTSIPNGTPIRVDVGLRSGPSALSFGFTTGATAQPLTPTSIRWAGGAAPFVNTGRHPIALYDYLFDAGSGKVGFRAG
jgi:hypothetical protein